MKTYDAVVIGSGPAGGEVARQLNAAGKNVAIVEKDGFGGVCPLRGCNPKKVLLAVPEAVHAAKALTGLGIADQPTVDFPALAAFRDSFVEPISDQVENHYFEIGVDVYYGAARMTGPNTVAVDGEEIRGEYVVLGPGMIPRPLTIPGAEHLATSDDFLVLTELPKKLVFIGGGFVALELAGIAAHCGAEVTVLVRSTPLKQFDPTLVDQLVEALRDSGQDIRLGVNVQSAALDGDQTVLTLSDGSTLACDRAFNCAGRIPDLEGLDLEAGKVAYSSRGIEVNDYMQSTTNPSVYAAGDAADSYFALTPTATFEAQAVAANIIDGNHAVPNLEGTPSVCFTLPPIASAGLPLEVVEQMDIEHRVLEGRLAPWFPWKRLGAQHGGYRIIVSEKEDRILGAHVFGHEAGELINSFSAFIRLRSSLAELRKTVWAYPTAGYYFKYMLQ